VVERGGFGSRKSKIGTSKDRGSRRNEETKVYGRVKHTTQTENLGEIEGKKEKMQEREVRQLRGKETGRRRRVRM